MKRKKKQTPSTLAPDEEPMELEEELPENEDEPHDFDHPEGPLEGEDVPVFHAPIQEERSLSAKDPLKRYLEEVSRYPLMDAEQELEAALRLRETGDITAAKQLVRANLRLVIKIAFEYRTYYSNLLDLIQEGNIGLMKAVSKFDPAKGARLGYYASWWIRSYILKYLLDNFRLVKIGTTQAQKKLFYHLLKEKEKLEAQGLLAGPKLLAERLQVREKDVVDMQQRLSGSGIEVSIDAPTDGSESAFAQRDFIPDQKTLPDEALERHELLQMLQDKLPAFRDTLSEKELRILDQRVLAEEPKTLQDIASHYGLTRERARQIEAKLIEKLRRFLSS